MILSTILVGLVFFSQHLIVYSLNCYIENKGKYEAVEFFLAAKKVGKIGYKIQYLKQDSIVRTLIVDDMTSDSSAISKIFSPIYENPSHYNYIQYSDEPPKHSAEIKLISHPVLNKKADSKGAFILDSNSGKALLFQHCVPEFLPSFDSGMGYSFPQEYEKDGLSFFCIVLDIKYVRTILKHILIRNPKIYGKKIHRKYDDVFSSVINEVNEFPNAAKKNRNGKIVVKLEDDIGTLNGKSVKIITKTSKVIPGPLTLVKSIGNKFSSNPRRKSRDNRIIVNRLLIDKFDYSKLRFNYPYLMF